MRGQSTRSTRREAAPGGHHQEVGTPGKGELEVGRTGDRTQGRSMRSTRRGEGGHHLEVGTPGKGELEAGRTGDRTQGRSMRSTRRGEAPG